MIAAEMLAYQRQRGSPIVQCRRRAPPTTGPTLWREAASRRAGWRLGPAPVVVAAHRAGSRERILY
ncbi:hypothetical protein BDV95DRAFT_567245 [Massariosphaeria phaeospora]|uniref:Uncharacterized protein n=1 Tax=Massariosphaeria phaeospora TaxID=100035 RepID=A0A7C8MRX5_9PLEO|nr:hypothetical protein BDV95DRAFT_567245 [Massariosphaeria phaeospora]